MAASLKEIPGELRQSITNFLGTPEVILQAAQLHVKSKVEDIVLALMPWRAFVLLARLPLKVQVSFSFLSVQMIRIKESNQCLQVVIETDASSYEFEFSSLDELEQVVVHMVVSLKKLFPDSSLGIPVSTQCDSELSWWILKAFEWLSIPSAR